MNNTIKFNANITEAEFQTIELLLTQSPCVMPSESIVIETVFSLDGQSVEELQATRNTIVKHYADLKRDLRSQIEVDWDLFDKFDNAMSKSVAVIDNQIMSR